MTNSIKTVISLFKYNLLLVVFVFFIFSCKSSKSVSGIPASSKENADENISDRERIQFNQYFFNANKEQILGNYELAETMYLQALKIDPNSAATMYQLASIYGFQNNKSQALYYSKKAAALDPKNVWYQLLYARCLKENKMHNQVAEVYELLVKNYPENYDFYYELANVYIFLNKPNEAIKVYNKIENGIGVTEEASLQKIKIYRNDQNFEKAILEAQKLIKAFPKESKYYGILGELYVDSGQNEKALEAYNELLKIDPSNAFVHLSLADYYRSQKQNDKAFKEIKIAFESTDLDIDTKVKILLSYYDITENYPELKTDADELCQILIKVHPDEAKAFAIYGDFLYRDHKLELARTQYRKAIELDKEKFALWSQLLIIESELDDIDAMLKESKEALELFPNQPLPYFFNGIALNQQKKYAEAVSVLKEGKEFVFDNDELLAQFYSTIGDAQHELQLHHESDESYEKSLELDPSNAYVLNNYAYYLSERKKDLEKAERMSKKSNTLAPNNSSYQDTYGWILFQMKKYDDAKIWIGKAIENGGQSNAILLEHYGDVLYQLGDIESALKYWMEAKKHGSTSPLLDKKITDKKLYE